MLSARKMARRAVKIWPLIVVLVVSIVGAAAWPLLTISARDIGIKKHRKITKLIYPTFGNPAIVEKGESFTVEFDPREQEFNRSFIKLEDFKVKVRSSNGPCPITSRLPVVSTNVGYSGQWPEYGKSFLQDKRMYLLTVNVPGGVPTDLYDLTVEANKKDGNRLTDTQPHAFQAVGAYKDPFSFCQLTDIHVYGPEIEYADCHERSKRPNGADPKRKGAIYYRKAISQINLMKPDFCVYTGDYMYGQAYLTQDQGSPWGWTTEYEYEQLWFYEETLKLDVPIFMTVGNHDSFDEGDDAAKEDWLENWKKLYGPLYHSFDYGDYHFLALNTQDWPAKDRILVDYDFAIQPAKYKGQLRDRGDKWAPGFTEARLEEIDESKFKGQLAWMRDDLEAHQGARMRICAGHEDPWLEEGWGAMWASEKGRGGDFFYRIKRFLGFAGCYGNGRGRLAFIKLMRDYRVSLMVSGHFHSDCVGSTLWKGGGGEVKFVNTTCTQFPYSGVSTAYPGYRRIWINNGELESYNYKEPKWSYPWYRGTNVGGVTNLDALKTPAIVSSFSPESGRSEDVTLTVDNSLEKPLPGAFAEITMPYLSGGYYYQVSNGTFGDVRDNDEDSPDARVCQVLTDVAPGETKSVRVAKSSSPDTAAPSGTLQVNGGATSTSSRSVTLNSSAVDEGGAGIKDMMISNTPDFRGAHWQPYQSAVPWTLLAGGWGERSVYVKLRDTAMPGNVSDIIGCTILYGPAQ